MRLLEFQAKRILTEYGIPVPQSVLMISPEDLRKVSFPAVLKAQLPIGGRGKAGAIRIARGAEEGASMIRDLFSATVKGYPVEAILAEELIDVQKELYVAYLIDKQANLPLLMASVGGGVEIEEVSKKTPEQIVKRHVDPFLGIQDFLVRPLAKALKVDDFQSFRKLVETMVRIFHEKDATLVEINPLAMTTKGLVALDAKILLDDKAAYRQQDLFKTLQAEQKQLDKRVKTRPEQLAERTGITYVPLDGDVGMIADGAGTGMLTLDLIHLYGGRAANFCEMGGLSNADTMEKSIDVILSNPRVKVLLIGLIGGMTRMDEMADGIVQYVKKAGQTLPIVVRMCGTKADIGKARLKEVGIEAYEDLSAAVQDAVSQGKEL
jgi:succinyl-CoA synthetase beta subunit